MGAQAMHISLSDMEATITCRGKMKVIRRKQKARKDLKM